MDRRPNIGTAHAMAFVIGSLAFVALLTVLVFSSGHADAKTVTLTSDAQGKYGLVDKAIKDSAPNDIIILEKGVFLEGNLSVANTLTIVGDEESILVAESIKVSANNVTFHSITISLSDGVLYLEGDNWTLTGAVMQECLGFSCVRVESTNSGKIVNSTFMGLASDAIDINASTNITINGAYIYAPQAGFRINNTKNVGLWDIKVAQASLGLYLSWCDQVRLSRSVFDTKGWGVLAANSTNITLKDTLFISNSAYLANYGIYLAFSKNVTVGNNTFTGDAAGISLWKSSGVVASDNSIFGNLEGIWTWESDLTMVNNAIFDNVAFALNVTGYSPTAINNYWGTSIVSDAKKLIRGNVIIEPIKTTDTTPDSAPLLLMPIPNITNGTEDASAQTLLELGPYFADDTWYVQAWTPRPSKVMFTVLYNSDRKNVSVSVSETGTCSGTCKDVEGELKASTTSNWYGTVQIQVRARDWRGKHVDTNVFNIIFTPTNDRPVIKIDEYPKNSQIDIKEGRTIDLNITIYDDSASVWLEVRVDNGSWKVVSPPRTCKWDNATKEKALPSCTKTVYVLKSSKELDVGNHQVAFRACDAQHCSDELYTGRYDLGVSNTGSSGKDFSLIGAGVAIVFMVLIALVALAMSGQSEKKDAPKTERPIKGKAMDEDVSEEE